MNVVAKIVCMVLFHVVMPMIGLASDIHILMNMIEHENMRSYVVIMVGIYFLPGLLQMINWTWTKTDGDCGWAEWSFWMVFSIFFPISVVIYQVVVVCRGRAYYKERHARIKVLNSISTMTKSQPQLILQLTMLLNEWEKDERHVSQAVSLGVHAAILTYHIAEHYFFEASGKGKKKLFSYKLVMRIVPFSLFNFTVRALVISFLITGAALNLYFMIVIIVLALGFTLANGVIAAATLQTSLLKSVFTSVAAIFLEKAVFFSKDDFDNTEETLRKFSRFGIFNGWAFFVTALLGLFTHLVWSLVFLNHPDEIPFDFFCHMDCVVSDWMEMREYMVPYSYWTYLFSWGMCLLLTILHPATLHLETMFE